MEKQMKCMQCENPALKGIHTCRQRQWPNASQSPYHDPFQQTELSGDKLQTLNRLLSLSPSERDRVLRAIGV